MGTLGLTFSLYSVAAAIFMLGLGLVILGVYQRFVYPLAFRRHEAAKAKGKHTRSPDFWRGVLRLNAMLIMPLLGFLLGDVLLG